MSWLSSLFGGGGGEDPRAVEQRNAAAAQQAAAQQQQMQQMQLDYLNSLRSDQAAKDAALAAKDPTATRQGAMSLLDTLFAPEFSTSYVPSTLTDPYEQQVYNEQRGSADELINRMLKRGVLTDTGATAARGELDKQGARVRAQLNDIGNTLLESERGKLGDIEGRARERASTLGVNQPFSLDPYSSALSTEVGQFTSGLPDAFRAGIPGDLFDTSTLGNIGGAAQGAGNQPFDLAGAPAVGEKSDETDPFSGQKPVQKRTATVF
jgi:hypothetical protein